MDIKIGDKVTYIQKCDSKIEEEVLCAPVPLKVFKDMYSQNRLEIIKIERPNWEVVEEKKELLTEEEREFLKDMIKYFEIKTMYFGDSGIDMRGENGSIENIPNYPKNMRFNGIEKHKYYTPKELRIGGINK